MDRFFRGLTAGIIGAIAMNLWSLFAVFILGWEVVKFLDWAGIILYGELPRSHVEGTLALLMQILWSGLLGVGFAYLIPYIKSEGYLIKGAFYGVIVGFIMYAIPTVLQMPVLGNLGFLTVLSNHIGGLIWGLVTAQTLYLLDHSKIKI